MQDMNIKNESNIKLFIELPEIDVNYGEWTVDRGCRRIFEGIRKTTGPIDHDLKNDNKITILNPDPKELGFETLEERLYEEISSEYGPARELGYMEYVEIIRKAFSDRYPNKPAGYEKWEARYKNV